MAWVARQAAVRVCSVAQRQESAADDCALLLALGLPPRAVERVLDELVDRAPAWLDRLDALPFDLRRLHKLR
ncbi:MAG: hypothetical protein GXP62_13355, partial [Oligoflexia bacterium]|nr:hypothetical protein [Oligoflexia bacterium]